MGSCLQFHSSSYGRSMAASSQIRNWRSWKFFIWIHRQQEERATGPGLSFWNPKAYPQWHTSSNMATPTLARPHLLIPLKLHHSLMTTQLQMRDICHTHPPLVSKTITENVAGGSQGREVGCSLFLFLPSYKLGVQLSVTVWHVLCLVDICHLCCSVPSAVCRGRGVCVWWGWRMEVESLAADGCLN